MNATEIRLECLKLAFDRGVPLDALTGIAQRLSEFVLLGNAAVAHGCGETLCVSVE
jgi:hypothetical protein